MGADNPAFNNNVENPGDGYGVMKYRQEAHEAMKGRTSISAFGAIESSPEYLRASI
jgi:hypothetical protein